jgi:hypothetical protein
MISGLSAKITRLYFPYCMKYFFIRLVAIQSLFFYSCTSPADPPVAKLIGNDSLLSRQDTFLRVKLYESPGYIQSGFAFDSIELENRKTKSSFNAHFPRLSQSEHPLLYQWVKEIVNDNLKWFKQDITAERPDSLLSKSVNTELLYQDKRILSIVLSESSSAYGRNYDWNHHSINYDIGKKKKIKLNDYFILKTTEDTTFLNYFLDQHVGGGHDIDIRRFDDLSKSFTFAVDSANVYFFFSRYYVFVGFGDCISITPKKYIAEHINPEYR